MYTTQAHDIAHMRTCLAFHVHLSTCTSTCHRALTSSFSDNVNVADTSPVAFYASHEHGHGHAHVMVHRHTCSRTHALVTRASCVHAVSYIDIHQFMLPHLIACESMLRELTRTELSCASHHVHMQHVNITSRHIPCYRIPSHRITANGCTGCIASHRITSHRDHIACADLLCCDVRNTTGMPPRMAFPGV